MNTKILLSALLVLFCLSVSKAQSHKVGQPNYNCKLNKKGWLPNSENLSCPACFAIRKKEEEAKKAEDKRRNDVAVAKAKAVQAALNAERKKELEELGSKNKVTELSVVMPKSTVAKNTPIKKGQVNTTDTAVLKANGRSRGFINEKGEALFENRTWRTTYSLEDVSMTMNPLKNFGLVDEGEGTEQGSFRADVINPKGEYLFNDPNIKFICHINDAWLLVGCYNSVNYYIYNLLTKKKIEFTSISEYNSETGRMIWGPAIDLFLPIFSDKIEIRKNNYSYQIQGKASASERVKKNLLKYFPNQISEEILEKQSFVLVHTNNMATYLDSGADYEFEKNLNSVTTLLLYCVTKDGKVSTIKLR